MAAWQAACRRLVMTFAFAAHSLLTPHGADLQSVFSFSCCPLAGLHRSVPTLAHNSAHYSLASWASSWLTHHIGITLSRKHSFSAFIHISHDRHICILHVPHLSSSSSSSSFATITASKTSKRSKTSAIKDRGCPSQIYIANCNLHRHHLHATLSKSDSSLLLTTHQDCMSDGRFASTLKSKTLISSSQLTLLP